MRLLSFLLLLQIAHSSLAIANVGMLHADGIVTMQGADISGTTITVIPANAPSYELAKGTKSFKLELPLNDTYLVVFAHPQCLTKQLFFDTRVPADYKLDHYTFPFEVVLEAQVTADRSYVGPVGYIMYRDLVNDFDYETNYTLQIDEKLKERMNSVHTTVTEPYVPAPGEREPARDPAVFPASITSTATAPLQQPSSNARVVGATAEHGSAIVPEAYSTPIEREAIPATLTSIEIEPQLATEVPPTPEQANMETLQASEPIAIENAPENIEQEAEATIAENFSTSAKADLSGPSPSDRSTSTGYRTPSSSGRTGHEFKHVDPMQFGRQEELIVESNKVTTIVRIVNEMGYYHEYRRVAHKFGAIFYFKDDQAIPAHMYADDTGLPAN